MNLNKKRCLKSIYLAAKPINDLDTSTKLIRKPSQLVNSQPYTKA